MTVSEILKLIKGSITPPMPKAKALEFLEELESEIEVLSDALREDVNRDKRSDKAE